MKGKVLIAAVVLAFLGQAAFATGAERKDLQVFNDISRTVNAYSQFTIFDDVSADVHDGVVILAGKVTMPYKKSDIVKRVAKIDGVDKVIDKITVLPVSGFDDQLRYRIANAIYRNPNFSHLWAMPNPPIHIVVDHGRVTLTGVVQSEVDRALARSLATGLGELSIKNELKTEAEMRTQLERS